jgi:hypothetical protein
LYGSRRTWTAISEFSGGRVWLKIDKGLPFPRMQLDLNDVAEGLATPALPDSYRQVPISGARVFDAVKQEPEMTPRLARGPREGRPYTLERVTASLHRNPF